MRTRPHGGVAAWALRRPAVGEGDLLKRLRRVESSRRRLRWLVVVLSALVVSLAAATTQQPMDVRLSPEARSATAAPARLFPPVGDLFYDQALQAYPRLRGDPVRRRVLAAQLLAAAAEHRVDPDLLFAVVAVESGFNPQAVSPRGARGLGQLLFGTARAAAPDRVRRPADLYEPARNLDATARLLRQLLDQRRGDLDAALRAYYGGARDRNRHGPDRDRYWTQVATRYAALKALRAHGALPPGRER